ncbi:serine hydrolase domain-containing protein [Oscillibacter ruminantium]|uniref:serine hydrolase domain-containing protein n=1 Tax=Oscillibacter ruminantium TaxID=1263547 RepID=UPI0002F548F2|nr:serine hydrolase domain-containing protein [Oscillibacter ruminantium]
MRGILKKRLAALGLALTMAVSLAVPAMAAEVKRAPASEARQKSAQTAVGYAMQYGGAIGASYALWEDGVFTISGEQINTPASLKDSHMAMLGAVGGGLYGIGSVSKMYTTAAVMKLVEAGKVKLDSPVTAYLKDFKMADSRYTKITVRMLLNHSSGLMGTSSTNAFLFNDDDQQATDELLERLSTQKLKAAPGAFSAYCNDGFTLAQLVVEAVSGKDFMDYVRSALLTPVGLANTYAPSDGNEVLNRLALTCTADAQQRLLPKDTIGIVGTGGLYATAEDLAAFGGAFTGTSMLSASSTAAMAAPEYDRGIWPDEPLGMVSYGLGWDAVEFRPFEQNGIQCLVKGGDTLRFHAALLVLPEYNMAAAVLTSGGVSVYNELAAAQMLADALEAKGVKLDRSEPALPTASPATMPASLAGESGYYGTTTQQLKATISADGKLTLHQMSMAGIPDQTLTYYSDGSFRDSTGAAAVKLVKESNGSTYFYQQSYAPLPNLGVLSTSDYLLVKMPENKVSAETQAAWDKLATVSAVPLAEKYSSQLYLALSDASSAAQVTSALTAGVEYVPGYVGGERIVSPTELLYDLPIGRDAGTVTVDGSLLWINGAPYQTENSLKNISTKSGAYSTIQSTGYARWYKVGAAAGKTMAVTFPEDAGFYVYNGDGTLAASSLLWGDTSVKLPEGGMIVFAGDSGARFQINFAS